MKIEVLYSPQCPNYQPAFELVHEILAETGINADIELIGVKTEVDAENMEFPGSPTVRVDGIDVEPRFTFAARSISLGCRSYDENGEVLGQPSYRVMKDTIEMGFLAEAGLAGRCC